MLILEELCTVNIELKLMYKRFNFYACAGESFLKDAELNFQKRPVDNLVLN